MVLPSFTAVLDHRSLPLHVLHLNHKLQGLAHRHGKRCPIGATGRTIIDLRGSALRRDFLPPPHRALLIIVDFIAEALGLPLLAPNFAAANSISGHFGKGVNFAVAGATALDIGFFVERGIVNPFTNSSPGVQLDLFKQLLPSLCGSADDWKEVLGQSLILTGEIGINDYNFPFLEGRNISEIRGYVPQELIDMGAKTILVPGNIPMGSLPVYLTIFETSDSSQYNNRTGCLNWLNEFAMCHNLKLRTKLREIRKLRPNLSIIFVDYYHAVLRLFYSPSRFGFNYGLEILKACCGGNGPYNLNSTVLCGNPGANLCDGPSSYVSWDGTHLTEAAYRWIFKGVFKNGLTIPKFQMSCPNS